MSNYREGTLFLVQLWFYSKDQALSSIWVISWWVQQGHYESGTTCSETVLSAKTPAMFLHSEILLYFSDTDHILEMLVCPVCSCDAFHPSLPKWSNRNGVCVTITLKSTCVLQTGHLGDGKKKAGHLFRCCFALSFCMTPWLFLRTRRNWTAQHHFPLGNVQYYSLW